MLLANMTTAAMVAEHFPDRWVGWGAGAAGRLFLTHPPACRACLPSSLLGVSVKLPCRLPPPVPGTAPPGCRALLRCHPPPNMHKMAELSATAAELGFQLDTSGAGGWVGGAGWVDGRVGGRCGRWVSDGTVHCACCVCVRSQDHIGTGDLILDLIPFPAVLRCGACCTVLCRPAAAVAGGVAGGCHGCRHTGSHHTAGHKAHAGGCACLPACMCGRLRRRGGINGVQPFSNISAQFPAMLAVNAY
jgi:hypothetical protein